jgi:integrase/recombinase XerD
MVRAKRITPIRSAPADESIHNPLRAHQTAFVEWTRTIGLAEHTALIRKTALDYFIRWCHSRSISSIEALSRDVLECYQAHLFHYRRVDGRLLTLNTQVARLNPLKAFCKWLARTRQIPYSPAADLIIPRIPRRLPGRVLTVAEVDRVMTGPDLASASGIRDRCILEVLYSTGLRRMEVTRLALADVLLEQESVFVRSGKGGRDRVVPLGWRAHDWIQRYLSEARPSLAPPNGAAALFLTDYGEPFQKNRLGDLVKKYVAKARIPIVGACHPFRHACATHMLENGADIRYIQALLGHADLSTTQIYTRVSIGKLREVHARTHPATRRRVPTAA